MSKEKDELAERLLAKINNDLHIPITPYGAEHIAEAVRGYIRKMGEDLKEPRLLPTHSDYDIEWDKWAEGVNYAIDKLIKAIEKGE